MSESDSDRMRRLTQEFIERYQSRRAAEAANALPTEAADNATRAAENAALADWWRRLEAFDISSTNRPIDAWLRGPFDRVSRTVPIVPDGPYLPEPSPYSYVRPQALNDQRQSMNEWVRHDQGLERDVLGFFSTATTTEGSDMADSDRWLMMEAGADVQQQLAAARIPFITATIASPVIVSGIAFPEAYRSQELTILGVETRSRGQRTNIENLYYLSAISERENFRVQQLGTNLEQWSGMHPLLQNFANAIRRDLYVRNMQSMGTVFADRHLTGELDVVFWATCMQTERKRFTRAFGHEVQSGSQGDGIEPSGLGFPITDDDGQIVAEVIGSTLYILFDMPHHGTRAELFLEPILNQAALILSPDGDTTASMEERRRELSRASYLKLCKSARSARLSRIKTEIASYVEQRETYATRLTEMTRNLQDLNAQEETLRTMVDDSEAFFMAEYDRLLNIEGITDVSVVGNKVIVTTEHIYTYPLETDNSVRDMGVYRVTFDLSGFVQCLNLTRQVNQRSHPHETGGGAMCLGNIESGMQKLIADYEFASAAQIMLDFLRSPNEYDSIGRRIFNWPIRAVEPVIPEPEPVVEPTGVDFDTDEEEGGDDFYDYDDYEDEEDEVE